MAQTKTNLWALAFLVTCLVGAAGLLVLGMLRSNDTDPLQPHRAVYAVKLERLASTGNMMGLDGVLTYDWVRDCRGHWHTQSKSTITYAYADGTARTVNSSFNTTEQANGRAMSFVTKRDTGGVLDESIAGTASKNANGAGVAKYTLPNGLAQDLAAPVYFPMDHARTILCKIKHGGTAPFYAYLFDGSDKDGALGVNTIIGDVVPAPADLVGAKNIDQGMLGAVAHRLHFSFFGIDDTDATPKFEMAVVAHANGMVSDARIDYDTFSVSQHLIALKPIQSPVCQ